MALFSKPPSPGTLHGALFNKRVHRNFIVAACGFVVIVMLLLWNHRPRVGQGASLPPLPMFPEVAGAHDFPTTSQFQPVSMDISNTTTEELCKSFPRHMLATVQPILKTGYSENRERFESGMDSVSACFAPGELLIFSDLQSSERGHEIIDIIGYLPDTYREHEQYQNYIDQKEMKANGTLDSDPEAHERIDGWALDKFKFLPGIQKAWEMRPNKDFYVFYESDTYVFWDNMFRHLQSLDPDQPLYFGSPSPGRDSLERNQKSWFANGGPGYVLSRGTMKKILHRRSGPTGHYIDPPFLEKWRHLHHKVECCGDSILGWVIYESEIVLQGYYPMFTPYRLQDVPYNDQHWCQPILTLHKPHPKDMVELFKWEFANRKSATPLMYSDLWQYRKPGSVNIRKDWNNEGGGTHRAPASVDTVEACEQFCRDDALCMQWMWKGQDVNECTTMYYLREGEQRTPGTEGDKKVDFTSGWLIDRADAWRRSDNCSSPQWPGPSLSRIY